MFSELRRTVKRARPDIVAVTHAQYRNTFAALQGVLEARGVALAVWSYERFFAARRLPWAAWILTDFDRLPPWQVELATRLYDALVGAGAPVLNDPRHFVPRAALLKRLHRAGVNDFTCWLPAFGEGPERFPVFLRTLAGHRGVASDLLHDGDAVERALAAALAAGHVVADLAFIEYAATPRPEGGFRKHACYRVGEAIIRALTISDRRWAIKGGRLGIASEDDYRRDHDEMTAYPHAELARRVFDMVGARYGRIDFGMVDDRPQIYELNTNPMVGFLRSHPSPTRLATDALQREQLADAFARLVPARSTAPSGRHVDVRGTFARPRLRRLPRAQP